MHHSLRRVVHHSWLQAAGHTLQVAGHTAHTPLAAHTPKEEGRKHEVVRMPHFHAGERHGQARGWGGLNTWGRSLAAAAPACIRTACADACAPLAAACIALAGLPSAALARILHAAEAALSRILPVAAALACIPSAALPLVVLARILHAAAAALARILHAVAAVPARILHAAAVALARILRVAARIVQAFAASVEVEEEELHPVQHNHALRSFSSRLS